MRTHLTKSIRIFLALLVISLLPALAAAQQVETHAGKWIPQVPRTIEALASTNISVYSEGGRVYTIAYSGG